MFYLHQNITGYTLPEVKDNGDRQTEMVAYNISNIVSKNFASAILNCYLMTSSAYSSAQTRLSQFADFSDVYTSFLFNLLSQSLKIKSLAQNMQTA
jgi:hypothetical protein